MFGMATRALKKVEYGYHDKIVSYQIRQNTFNFKSTLEAEAT